jgi:hypothetical protein
MGLLELAIHVEINDNREDKGDGFKKRVMRKPLLDIAEDISDFHVTHSAQTI